MWSRSGLSTAFPARQFCLPKELRLLWLGRELMAGAFSFLVWQSMTQVKVVILSDYISHLRYNYQIVNRD